MNKINYIIGDATKPVGYGHRVIAHVCNNRGGWGKGFVLALSRKWKEPEEFYRNYNNYTLGHLQIIQVDDGLSGIYVANLIAQDGFKSETNPIPLSYKHLSKCLQDLADFFKKSGGSPTVHMPRIGCGLAGGRWDLVEPIVKETLVGKGIEVFVYDLTEKDSKNYV